MHGCAALVSLFLMAFYNSGDTDKNSKARGKPRRPQTKKELKQRKNRLHKTESKSKFQFNSRKGEKAMTQTTNYIKDVTTLEELKQEYKRLALLHHPDIGGDTATMQAINAEYDRLFEALKNTHKNKAGEYYTRENTVESAGEWRELIEKLIHLHMENVRFRSKADISRTASPSSASWIQTTLNSP